jgi:hypothetical protein
MSITNFEQSKKRHTRTGCEPRPKAQEGWQSSLATADKSRLHRRDKTCEPSKRKTGSLAEVPEPLWWEEKSLEGQRCLSCW